MTAAARNRAGTGSNQLDTRMRRAVPWAMAESAISAVATFLATIIVARVLPPEAFGLAAVAFAVVTLCQLIAFAGVPQAMLRTPHLAPRLSDQLFWVMLALGAAGTAVSWSLAWPLARFYNAPLLFWPIAVQAIDCVLQALVQFPTTLLTRKMRTRSLAVRMLWFKAVSILASVVAAVSGAGAWSLVAGALAGSVASVVLLWRTQPRLPRWRGFDASVRPVLGMGWLIMIEAVFTTASVRGFILLFGKFHGLHDLGLLNFAMRLVDELGMLVTSTVNRISTSFFAGVKRTGQSLSRTFELGSHAIMVVVAPIFFGFAAVAPDLIPLLFGARWLPAIPAVQLLAIFWAIRLSRVLSPGLLRIVGAQGPLVFNAIVSLAFAIAAVLLTRDLGFVAAVAAFSARMLVTLPAGAAVLSRATGLSVGRQVHAVLLPLSFATIMAAVVMLCRHWLFGSWSPAARLAVSCLIGALIYGALTGLFDRRRLTALLRTQAQASAASGVRA